MKYGKDYGIPIAFRISTEHYEFFDNLAIRRIEIREDLFRQAIKEFYDSRIALDIKLKGGDDGSNIKEN